MGSRAEKAVKYGETQRQQGILARFYEGGLVDLLKGVAEKKPGSKVTIALPLGSPDSLMTAAIIYSTKFGISEGEGRIFVFDNGDETFSLGRGKDGIYSRAYLEIDPEVNADPDVDIDCFFRGAYGDSQAIEVARKIIEGEIGGIAGRFHGGDKILGRTLFGLGGYRGVASYRVIASSPKA